MADQSKKVRKTVKTVKRRKRIPLWKSWRFWILVFGGIFVVGIITNILFPKTELERSTEVVEWLNGSRNSSIGEVTVTKVPSSSVDDKFLQEWWEKYGSNPAFNTSIIVYTDKENEGVYDVAHTYALKDTGIMQDQWGDWIHGDMKDNTLVYSPDQSGKLVNTHILQDGQSIKIAE